MSSPRPELKTRAWKATRRAVLERDKNRCQVCGRYHARLHIDHVEPWHPGLAHDDVDNLQTLCPPCHADKTRAEDESGIAADESLAAYDEEIERLTADLEAERAAVRPAC